MSSAMKETIPGAVDNSARTEKRPGPAPTPEKMIPGERLPEDPESRTERRMDPVLDLLANGGASGNETVDYFLAKIRALAEEGIQLEEFHRDLMQKKAEAEGRMSAIRVGIAAYKTDAAHWLQRPGAKPESLE